MIRRVAFAICLFIAAPVFAQQTVINQTSTLVFTPSADHNATFGGQPVLTSYQVEFFPVAATVTTCPAPTGTPVVQSLGKPAPVNNTITTAPLAPMIATNQMYCGYVSAVGPGGTSARANAVGPFGVPGKPAAPTGAILVP